MEITTNQPAPQRSDLAEPSASWQEIPVWLLILLLLLFYWGMLYFDQHSGWFNQEVYAPFQSEIELARYQPPTSAGLSARGKLLYNKPSCVQCHQADGKGTPGQFPPLVKSEWVNEPEPGRLIRLVLNGLTGPLEFQGQNFNGTMVRWKDVFTDDEDIAAILTYVRQNKEWGNNAPEVKPERVKAVREKLKDRSQPFTPEELQKISPAE
jgi:mono/diheme cytochrome c family protein